MEAPPFSYTKSPASMKMRLLQTHSVSKDAPSCFKYDTLNSCSNLNFF